MKSGQFFKELLHFKHILHISNVYTVFSEDGIEYLRKSIFIYLYITKIENTSLSIRTIGKRRAIVIFSFYPVVNLHEKKTSKGVFLEFCF